VHCYNESCVQPDENDPLTYERRVLNRENLLDTVYHGLNRCVRLAQPSVVVQQEDKIEFPGKVIRLDNLAKKIPDHPAVQYVAGRGFDPVQLGKEYGFVFVAKVKEAKYQPVLGTILMPIYKDGELWSWISRCAVDTINGVPISRLKIKKYYNCPGRSLSAVGYRLDKVLQYSTVVLVEGIFDAIKTGPYATCLFSKSLPKQLRNKIVKGLQRYGDEAVVVVMLDPEQDEKEKARGVAHHIESVAASFTDYIANVLRVYLPIGKDPGSMTHEDITKHIVRAAQKAKIALNFERRKTVDLHTKYTPVDVGGVTAAGTGHGTDAADKGSREDRPIARKGEGLHTTESTAQRRDGAVGCGAARSSEVHRKCALRESDDDDIVVQKLPCRVPHTSGKDLGRVR
jgi:hypothetical protein